MTAEVLKYTLAQVEALELAPGSEHEKLEGWVPALAEEEDLRRALEKAFDYRGDVTLTLKNGTRIEAYIFNRRYQQNQFPGANPPQRSLRDGRIGRAPQ